MAKVLSVLLSLALLMALFSSSAFSEDKSDSISVADEGYEVEVALDETAIVSDEDFTVIDGTILTDSSIQNTSSYVSSASALSKTTSFVLDSLESSESQILEASSDATTTTEYLVAANTTENISIYTAQELYEFAEEVNAGQSYEGLTVTLENDIDLSELGVDWTPIGTSSTNSFSGTFDGGGYTISGLSITRDEWDETQRYVGLFGYVREATIQNITVSGEISVSNNDLATYAAGIVGYARSSEIKNCISGVNIRAYTWVNAGGIVGTAYYSTLENCIYYGGALDSEVDLGAIVVDVTYPTYAGNIGGIAGAVNTVEIMQCANYADIYLEGNQTPNGNIQGDADALIDYCDGTIGGLVGFVVSGGDVTIQNSQNSGNITGDMQFAGGLVGRFFANLTIQNSYNTGDITEDGDTGYRLNSNVRLAGLVATPGNSGTLLTLENCYNLGTIQQTVPSAYAEVVIREIHCVNDYWSDAYTFYTDETNVFTSDEMQDEANIETLIEASDRAFVRGVDGLPILAWVQAMLEAVDYTLVFSISPAEVQLTLYSDEDMATLVEPSSDTTFSVKYGIYYYEISAEGYMTETGSVIISGQDVTKEVSLKKAATVTFSISSVDVQDLDFIVTDSSGDTFTPDSTSEADGYTKYTYTLYDEVLCYYSAYVTGYDGITLPYVVNGNDEVVVELPLP